MGSIADCFDNAMIESFWSRMQVEVLNRKRWRIRIELGERQVRVPRDLAQPTPPAQRTGLALTSRVERQSKIVVA